MNWISVRRTITSHTRSMDFMSSPRGHILKFLWKQYCENFLDLSLDDIRKKLDERGSVSAKDFDTALQELESEGVVEKNAFTKSGLDVFAAEYKMYLSNAESAAHELQKADFASAQTAFDTELAVVKNKPE